MATAVEIYREINKVIVAAPRDLEPYQEQCFNAGYTAVTGARYPGEIKYYERTWQEALEFAKKNGYQMVMVPMGIFSDEGFTEDKYKLALEYYRDYGIQFIVPAGSNIFAGNSYNKTMICPIITGAGIDVLATGRKVEFFGPDVAFHQPDAILNIRKEGTVYNIASISRVSPTSLAVKLTGISNLNTIGFDDHGIPFTLSGLTGTDISPLPANGVYYTSYVGVGSDTMYIDYNTSAGTIGGFQSVSGGTMMFGVSSSRMFIRTTNYGYWAAGNVTLAGVTGFQYSPNGTYGIAQEYSQDNFGDKFSITFNPGTGSAVLKGTAQIQTSSYGNPYVGGVLAALVNYYKITFWKARHILRETSAQGGLYSNANGYGKFNIAAAKEYTGNFTADPYLYIGTIGTLTGYHQDPENIVLSLPHVTNATDFDIFLDDVQIETMSAFVYDTSAIAKSYTLTRRFPSQGKYKYQYRARIGTKQYTALSNAKYFKCFKATKIAV